MRLLFATPWLAPQGGGLERYAASVARELSLAGHEVTLLGHAPCAFDVAREGVRMVGVVPGARLSNTPLSFAIHRVARRLLSEIRVDVVNVHTPVPGTAELVARAAGRAGVPVAVTYHAGVLGAPAGPLALAARAHALTFERALLSRAQGRIAVSRYVAERVFRARPSLVIPPGVDARHFRRVAPPVPGRILFVGPVSRAYAWKGLAVLADAFERLQARVPGAHLRVVGEGDLVDAYRARFAQRDVVFAGRVAEASLPREYSEASVVVLPSITAAESFGMVLAEANACERPVVASDVGGIPCFVRDGENGLLVPPGDASALADAIERVLADPSLARRLGANGRARVVREHRWKDLAARTARALASL